ncbi:MAG: hypothetical protein RLZZ08_1552 [Pseudomonadota bacterium]|jgi:putative membrane protein
MTKVFLTTDEHRRVSEAVAAAEGSTSGEIVTIVADRSDGYTDVALAWAALFAFMALTVLALFPHFYLGLIDRVLGRWNSQHTPAFLFALAAAVAMSKFFGTMLLSLIPGLRFAFVPGIIRSRRVHARAVGLFKVGAEQRTQGRTGILIYLSMRERRAEILADEAIAAKVQPGVWGDAMVALLAEVRQGRVADGMIAAVGQVGVILAHNLPRADDDTNELPDRLIEL